MAEPSTVKLPELPVTVSRVLFASATAEPERVMLRKWAEWAAENGGAFSCKQELIETHWYTTWMIHWPAALSSTDGGKE